MSEDKYKKFYIKPLRIWFFYDGDGCLEMERENWRALLMYPPAFSIISTWKHFEFTWNIYRKYWFSFYMDR